MSTCWLIGGGCGLDRISENQTCKALSTWGRNDSRFRFVVRTFPSSTIPFNFDLCFFHVDSVDGLKPNWLHRSLAFIPFSNFRNISIFSFSVRSVCCRFTLEQDILKCVSDIMNGSLYMDSFLLMLKESKETIIRLHDFHISCLLLSKESKLNKTRVMVYYIFEFIWKDRITVI